MNRSNSEGLSISLDDVLTLAIEHWRLSTAVEGASGNLGTIRHALRRIGDVLAAWQVEAQSLDGRPFDAGLAAQVVDTIDDPAAPPGIDTVAETVSPLVLWHGTVVKPAEIVVLRGHR